MTNSPNFAIILASLMKGQKMTDIQKSNAKAFWWGFTHLFGGDLSELLTLQEKELLSRDFKDIKRDYYAKYAAPLRELDEKFKKEIATLAKK